MSALPDFRTFFSQGTGYQPYPYQVALATRPVLPQLMDIPTGLGKTAAVILAWLWRQYGGTVIEGVMPPQVAAETPRRLVYCLPMRVLVEQTAENAGRWIENLVSAGLVPVERRPEVQVLMGGEIDRDWDLWPDRETILVGTQDQLLSRALNRGYAMSRYRWPIHFALINNDALWVMDEVQLMGPGLPTTVQLQGFREKAGAYGTPQSLWMSATLSPDQFDTIDSPLAGKDWSGAALTLGDDLDDQTVRRRIGARKVLRKSDLVLDRHSQKGYAEALAAEVKARHEEVGDLTIVILNRVRRAQDLSRALTRKSEGMEGVPGLTLIHSRFRPHERRRFESLLRNLGQGRDRNEIVVATQAIEAGVDISASTLITELAPWPSLVQRFGRLNRYGEMDTARAYWVDITWRWEEDGKSKTEPGLVRPYAGEELDLSRGRLLELTDVGSQELRSLGMPPSRELHPLVRRKDIFELFDTTPDLAGNDIDVSPYIRDAENMDVSVFWRDWEGDSPPSDLPAPLREELCPVPLYDFRDFLRERDAWIWDGLESSWDRLDPNRLRPGLTVLLHTSAGGYDPQIGWLGRTSREPVTPVEVPTESPEEAIGDDPATSTSQYETIAVHSTQVSRELARILEVVSQDGIPGTELLLAALWHDRGKAHEVFQNAVRSDGDAKAPQELWAKAPRLKRYERPHFRHELASALALLLNGGPDLAAYLVASHHGKVRLSIRSLPGEAIPPTGGRFARGIWDSDLLPAADLGNGVVAPEVTLTLDLMELGESDACGPSWLERTLKLLAGYGPFRLAYLESLLRVADWRASGMRR
jgi:CRISPR-associated endonuclease/helicase Cas3